MSHDLRLAALHEWIRKLRGSAETILTDSLELHTQMMQYAATEEFTDTKISDVILDCPPETTTTGKKRLRQVYNDAMVKAAVSYFTDNLARCSDKANHLAAVAFFTWAVWELLDTAVFDNNNDVDRVTLWTPVMRIVKRVSDYFIFELATTVTKGNEAIDNSAIVDKVQRALLKIDLVEETKEAENKEENLHEDLVGILGMYGGFYERELDIAPFNDDLSHLLPSCSDPLLTDFVNTTLQAQFTHALCDALQIADYVPNLSARKLFMYTRSHQFRASLDGMKGLELKQLDDDRPVHELGCAVALWWFLTVYVLGGFQDVRHLTSLRLHCEFFHGLLKNALDSNKQMLVDTLKFDRIQEWESLDTDSSRVRASLTADVPSLWSTPPPSKRKYIETMYKRLHAILPWPFRTSMHSILCSTHPQDTLTESIHLLETQAPTGDFQSPPPLKRLKVS